MQNSINEPSTSVKTNKLKPASDNSSETIFPLFPNSSSSPLSTSSVDGFLNCESEDCHLNNTLTSSFQRITHSFKLRSRPFQSSSSSRTRSTSSSNSAMLLHHAQYQIFASDSVPNSFPGFPLSLKYSSGTKTSFTVLSQPKSIHLSEDQESVSSLSAIKTAELPYHWLDKISIPPTLDPYFYPLLPDN